MTRIDQPFVQLSLLEKQNKEHFLNGSEHHHPLPPPTDIQKIDYYPLLSKSRQGEPEGVGLPQVNPNREQLVILKHGPIWASRPCPDQPIHRVCWRNSTGAGRVGQAERVDLTPTDPTSPCDCAIEHLFWCRPLHSLTTYTS